MCLTVDEMSDISLRADSGKVGITEQTIITLVCNMLHPSLMHQIKGLLTLFQIIESFCPEITENVINMSDVYIEIMIYSCTLAKGHNFFKKWCNLEHILISLLSKLFYKYYYFLYKK